MSEQKKNEKRKGVTFDEMLHCVLSEDAAQHELSGEAAARIHQNVMVSVDADRQRKNCDWVVEQANEIKALLAYNSKSMIALNKVRALAAIDTAMQSLAEIRAYIESVQEV